MNTNLAKHCSVFRISRLETILTNLNILKIFTPPLASITETWLRNINDQGDIGLFIILVPKVFLFVGLITLGTCIEFLLVGSLS